MNELIINELGGGAVAILVIMMLGAIGTLALVVRAMWERVKVLQDLILSQQLDCNRDIREVQAATNQTLSALQASLNAVQTTLATLVATIAERKGS